MKIQNVWKIYFLIFILCTSCGYGQSADIETALYNKWQVKSFSSLPISALSDEEAKKFIGKYILLQSNIVVILGDTCTQPDYRIQKKNTNDYLKQYKVPGSAVGIKSDSIYSIDVKCKIIPKYFNDQSPEFGCPMLLEKFLLNVIYNGIVFHLIPVKE